jgi:mono/diheme cytochrome c family protein
MSKSSNNQCLIKKQFVLPPMPFWIFSILMIGATLALLPIAIIARSRSIRSPEPRVSILQDMGRQPKVVAQDASEVFADGRGNRPGIPGTVSIDDLQDDDHYYRGYTMGKNDKGEPEAKFFSAFPSQVKVDDALLERGQERFNIYCSACHGYDGSGHGSVNERAMQLMGETSEVPLAKWVQVANLHAIDANHKLQYGPEVYPSGKLFNTITHGVRNMAGYEGQIPVADRWAIVAYVHALQLSQHSHGVSAEAVPAATPTASIK